MNKLSTFLLSLFACLLLACEKEPNEGAHAGTVVNNDEYYIHYIVSANYPYIFSNVHYATEHGEGSFLNYQTRGWNETIGPVKKGFSAWVRADNGTSTCKIQVSKNGSAFATKATGSNRASFTINY